MITIIIVLIIVGYLFYRDECHYCFIEHLAIFVKIGVTTVLIGGTILIVLPADTEINKYEYDLVTLQDNFSNSGSFFLGSGNIDGKMKYVYYYKSQGGFKMGQIDYDNAVIRYGNTPRIDRYRREMVDNWKSYFAMDIPHDSLYVITVPKGTIKTNYNLDAQ